MVKKIAVFLSSLFYLVRPTWLYANEVKVLYRCPRIVNMLYQLLAEGKGISARECLEEAGMQNREPMYKNVIEGSVPEASQPMMTMPRGYGIG